MTILLTGGAGFIGSHTAVELIAAGHSVVIVDNFVNSRRSVLDRLQTITGVSIPCFETDVRDAAALTEIFTKHPIDAVIHFAGLKAVGESVAKPLLYYRNNLDASLTLLEVMAEHSVKAIVFSSSATVYGVPAALPFVEDMPAGGCTNPYGRTKHMIEQMIEDASNADAALSAVLLRYFNPIGAHASGLIGEDPEGIPNNLMPYICQAAAGIRKELTVYGNDYPTRDGTGVRDYLHVTDLARGHVRAVEYALERSGCEVFNLGTGVGYSVLEVIHAFETATGVKVPYVFGPRRAGDIAEFYAGPEKSRRVLGWETKLSLEDMCRDSWNWQQHSGGF